jgi:HEAT repeat protein
MDRFEAQRFQSDLALEEMLERLNSRGLWKWQAFTDERWGDKTGSTGLACYSSSRCVDELVRVLPDSSEEDQWKILWHMGRMDRPPVEVVPALIAILRGPPKLRVEAIDVLGRIGVEAGAAAPGLIEALKDGDWKVRFYAASVLGKIAPGGRLPVAVGEVVAALKEALED